ncbi:MAG TPA: hypothetical protein VF475_16750 [Sphingobium sp.]
MTMEKQIKSELIKMSAIMVVLVGLGIYAHEFVLAGLKAKLALNLSIFILAGLAAWLAFHHVLALKNETVALKALQVDYGSIRRRPVNPYRHPAVVFNEPELLGQGYRMITEEFSKQDEVKISNSTVQMLLHDVDQRINDRKSTIMYFSGLMVFLGLLGAFMGLMKTVHSVSDLIGGMDLSGSSGTEGMAKMIEGMKAPLNGMSVGFSSSLFGLMTSMVLGALERCMTSAMKALRNEFEHWLSNLADLEGHGATGQNEVSVKVDADFSDVKTALEIGSRQIESVRTTVAETADHAVQTRTAMGEMAHSVTRLSRSIENIYDPAPLLQPISHAVSELARNQIAMLAQFKGLYDQAEADRAHIRAILGGMTATVERMTTLNGGHLHGQLDNLAVLLADAGHAQAATPRSGLFSRLFGSGATGVRQELRRMMLSQRRLARQQGEALDTRLARMEAGRDEDRTALNHLVAQTADQQARLESLLAMAESVDPTALSGVPDLSGARREMDVLQRRLNAETESAAPPVGNEPRPAAMKGY